MSIDIRKEEDVIIVSPVGRLDTTSSPEAEELVKAQLEAGELKFVINFAETTFVASAGLRVLLMAAKSLHQTGGKLMLCCAEDQIFEVLESSGFLTMMSHEKTLEAAIQSVQ